ncbi:MAG: hypothetical protein SXA11_19005 [Cyanobacteriota bacterium]|nr:hypothetical protein [Cyanobacteriota bacterium]
MRRSRGFEENEELNVWPAFTDLMSNAFMILSLFLLLAIIKAVFVETVSDANEDRALELEEDVTSLEELLKRRTTRVRELEGTVTGLRGRVSTLQSNLDNRSDKIGELEAEVERLKSPPVIVIRDSQERRFESGSAALSGGLESFIEEDLVGQIENFAKEYEGYVVEVIGHTDGQVNIGAASNLDLALERVANGSEPVSTLQGGSNADLGLMRALAVVKQLQENPRLKKLGLKFRAYSAAQLYTPGGDYAGVNRNPEESRRRIEVRFTPTAVER